MYGWERKKLSPEEFKIQKRVKVLEKKIKETQKTYEYLKAHLGLQHMHLLQLEGRLPHQQVSGKLVKGDEPSELKHGHTKATAADITHARKDYHAQRKEVVGHKVTLEGYKQELKQLDPENKLLHKKDPKNRTAGSVKHHENAKNR